MRNVSLSVGGTPLGLAPTWAYPKGEKLGYFLVPYYKLTVTGTNAKGVATASAFPVLRFGVMSRDGVKVESVGLAQRQTHTIKAWIPTYRVHSAVSLENGAWQVYDNFLIHDGPDSLSQVFATIGCVEIMGPSGFVKFNDLLISLAGSSAKSRDGQLADIGKSGRLTITYEQAARPAVKKYTGP